MKILVHRLFHRWTSKWKTIDEYKIDGIDWNELMGDELKIKGYGPMIKEMIDELRSGYKIIHQECMTCGDRRTLRMY